MLEQQFVAEPFAGIRELQQAQAEGINRDASRNSAAGRERE